MPLHGRPAGFRVTNVLIAVAFGALSMHAAPRQASRTVLAAVVDATGTPILGLTAAEFAVHAGDRSVRVLSAAPATDPLAIAIVTDGIDPRTSPHVRGAMRQIVEGARAQSPGARVGLVAARPGTALKLEPATGDAAELERAIDRFVGSDESWPLLESLLAAAAALEKEPSPRRVIIAISRRHDPPAEPVVAGRDADAVRRSGASLWALDLGWSGALAEVAPRSGGRHLVARPEALAATARSVMDVIRSQYVVTCLPPDSVPGALHVRVRRPDATVLAPAWER